MNRLKVYFDEDALNSNLLSALRANGVEALTALEVGLIKASDECQLMFATGREFVLYTFNMGDFYRIHTE